MMSIQNKLEKLNELQKNVIDYGMKPSSVYYRLFSPVHNALADTENIQDLGKFINFNEVIDSKVLYEELKGVKERLHRIINDP